MNVKYPKKSILLGVVIILVAVVVAAVVIFLPKKAKAPIAQPADNSNQVAAVATSTVPMKMAPIPQGSETYQIMQAAAVMPKIIQATVDPVNVHVGDTQTLTVIVSDPNPITSVVASVHTDNGTTTIPLALVGPAALNDVIPQKYFVNAQNQMAFAGPENSAGNATGNIAQAAEGNEKYSATWTVKDTHVARYYTIFTASDAKGNVNSARIDWTDAVCSWNGNNNYGGGTWDANSTYGSGGCTFLTNETDGVENGNVTIDAPMTLVSGSDLIFNSGYSITLSGSGQLSIQSGAEIQQSDMYCGPSTWSTSFNNGTDAVLRSSLSSNVFPGQTAYFLSPTLTNYGSNTWNYNCGATVNTSVSGSANCQGGSGTNGNGCAYDTCTNSRYIPIDSSSCGFEVATSCSLAPPMQIGIDGCASYDTECRSFMSMVSCN